MKTDMKASRLTRMEHLPINQLPVSSPLSRKNWPFWTSAHFSLCCRERKGVAWKKCNATDTSDSYIYNKRL